MKNTINAVIDHLRTSGPKDVVFFFGNPLLYQHQSLPIVAVAPYEDEISVRTTAKDEHGLAMQIYTIVSARAEFSSSGGESVADSTLIDLVDGVRDTEGNITEPGVVSALRGNITLDGQVMTIAATRTRYRSGLMGQEAVRIAITDVTARKVVAR